MTDAVHRWWLKRASSWHVLFVKMTAPHDGNPVPLARFEEYVYLPVSN
jgi:hypothetical protein